MLVLNRKVGEKICIDGQITVIVNRIQGNRVSLAIEAPHEVHIVRGELRPFVADLQSNQETPATSGVPVVDIATLCGTESVGTTNPVTAGTAK